MRSQSVGRTGRDALEPDGLAGYSLFSGARGGTRTRTTPKDPRGLSSVQPLCTVRAGTPGGHSFRSPVRPLPHQSPAVSRARHVPCAFRARSDARPHRLDTRPTFHRWPPARRVCVTEFSQRTDGRTRGCMVATWRLGHAVLQLEGPCTRGYIA
jgi:hypothetical protein